MADAEDLKSRRDVCSNAHRNAAVRKSLDSNDDFSLWLRTGPQRRAWICKTNRHHYRHRKSKHERIDIETQAGLTRRSSPWWLRPRRKTFGAQLQRNTPPSAGASLRGLLRARHLWDRPRRIFCQPRILRLFFVFVLMKTDVNRISPVRRGYIRNDPQQGIAQLLSNGLPNSPIPVPVFGIYSDLMRCPISAHNARAWEHLCTIMRPKRAQSKAPNFAESASQICLKSTK